MNPQNPDQIEALLSAIAPTTKPTKAYKSGIHAVAALHKKATIQTIRPWAFKNPEKRINQLNQLVGNIPRGGIYRKQLQKSELIAVDFSGTNQHQNDSNSSPNAD